MSAISLECSATCKDGRKRTPCDDVEDEDYESDDAASSGALPIHGSGLDGCSFDEEGERELEKSSEGELKHGGSGFQAWSGWRGKESE